MDENSATFRSVAGQLVVCSRNNVLTEFSPQYHSVAARYQLAAKLAERPHLVLQGEIYGPKVNKNLLGVHTLDLAVFTIHDTRTGDRLSYQAYVDMCKELGVPYVPVLETGVAFKYTVDELVEMSKGHYEHKDGRIVHREGIVVRAQDGSLRHEGDFVSFKIINPDYLLQKRE